MDYLRYNPRAHISWIWRNSFWCCFFDWTSQYFHNTGFFILKSLSKALVNYLKSFFFSHWLIKNQCISVHGPETCAVARCCPWCWNIQPQSCAVGFAPSNSHLLPKSSKRTLKETLSQRNAHINLRQFNWSNTNLSGVFMRLTRLLP